MKIGFIGLGNMGGPMAANLAKAGHEVTGFDTADVEIEGVAKAGSATEVASGAQVVITMLPNGAILKSVAEEIIPAMDKGAVLLDCSTVEVEAARDAAAACDKAGQPVEIHMRDGYDHSYFFIATFIEDHLRFHAQALEADG